MSEILSSNVTVTVSNQRYERTQKTVRGTISFGNGILGMPVGGVPLPALSSFGLIRNMATLDLYPTEGTSNVPYIWHQAANRIMPTVDSMSPEVEGKLNELNAHTTSTGVGVASAIDGAEDRPLRTTLNYVATGW